MAQKFVVADCSDPSSCAAPLALDEFYLTVLCEALVMACWP